MKIKNFKRAFATFGVLAFASSLSAQSSSGWDGSFQKRFYIGVGGGTSRLDPDTSEVDGVDVVDDSDGAAQVTLGFDFSRRLSAELQYIDLGTSELTGNADIDYSELSLSGVYYLWNGLAGNAYADYDGLDLRTGLSFYGRAGLGEMDNTARGVIFRRENDYQFLIGLGVEYAMNNGLGIRAEFTAYDTDANYQGLSLIYRFGSRGLGVLQNEPDLPNLPAPAPLETLPPPPVPAVLPSLPSGDLLLQSEASWGLDFDSDGVVDDLDACPDTPPGTPVNTLGCEMFNGVLEGVNFNTNSDILIPSSTVELDEVVATLNAFPEVNIAIHAHTDSQGDEDNNLELSRRRALAVARYLTSKGIAMDRLQARAFGETRPIADNSTKEGRLVNRRVEFRTVR